MDEKISFLFLIKSRLYFPNLIYYKRLNTTGHFLSLEDPNLFVSEVDAFVSVLMAGGAKKEGKKDEL